MDGANHDNDAIASNSRSSPPLKRKRSTEDQSNATLAIHLCSRNSKPHRFEVPERIVANKVQTSQAQREDLEMSDPSASPIVCAVPDIDDETSDAIPAIIINDDNEAPTQTPATSIEVHAAICESLPMFLRAGQGQRRIAQLDQLAHHYRTEPAASTWMLLHVTAWLEQQCVAMQDQQTDWVSVYSIENGSLPARIANVILELANRTGSYLVEDRQAETLINLIEVFTRWAVRLVGFVSRTSHEAISKNFEIICDRPLRALQDAAAVEFLCPLAWFLHKNSGLDVSCVRNAIASQLKTTRTVRDMAHLLLELINAQEESGEVATNSLLSLSVNLAHAMHCNIVAVGQNHDRFASSIPVLELPTRIATILKAKTDKETPESNCPSRKMLLEAGANIALIIGQPLPTSTLLHTMSREEASYCVRFAWLTDVAHHFIKRGYLTLRISAMEVMRTDLVELYSRYIKAGKPHKVHNFAAQHLQSQGILDTILGADSHMEVLTRTPDMLKFFVFTRQFTQKVSDLFWQATIRTGQDQQAAAALGTWLRLLKDGGAELQAQDISTFCTSLLKHPLPEISPLFCDLIRELNRQALENNKGDVAEKHANAHIVLQVRLLGVSLHDLSPTRTLQDLQQEAEKTLCTLGKLEGDLLDERSSRMRSFVKECIANIASADTDTEFDASVLALSCLCNGSSAILQYLSDETQCLDVVKSKICYIIDSAHKSVSKAQTMSYQRLLCLLLQLCSRLDDNTDCLRTLVDIISNVLRNDSLKALYDATLSECDQYIADTFRAIQSLRFQSGRSAENGQFIGNDRPTKVTGTSWNVVLGISAVLVKVLRKETISSVSLRIIHLLARNSESEVSAACTAGGGIFQNRLIDSLWRAIYLAPTEHLADTAAVALAQTLSDLTPRTFTAAVGQVNAQKVLDNVFRDTGEKCLAALEEASKRARGSEDVPAGNGQCVVLSKRILRFMRQLMHEQSGSMLPNTTDIFRRSARMNELMTIGDVVKLTCDVKFDGYRSGAATGPRNFSVRVGTYDTERNLFLRLAFILGSTELKIFWGDRQILDNPMQVLEPDGDTLKEPIIIIARPAVAAQNVFTEYLADNMNRLMALLNGDTSDELSASIFDFLDQFKRGRHRESGNKILVTFSRLDAFDRPFEALVALRTIARIVDDIEIGQYDFPETTDQAQQLQTMTDQGSRTDLTNQPQDADMGIRGHVNGSDNLVSSRDEFERHAVTVLQSLLLDQRRSESRSRIYLRMMRDAARCLATLLRVAQSRAADSSPTSTGELIRRLVHLCAGPCASGVDASNTIASFYELLIAYATSSEIAGDCFYRELSVSHIHRDLIFRSSVVSQATYICSLIRTHLMWKEFGTPDLACGPKHGLKPLTALNFFWQEIAECIDQTAVSNGFDISIGLGLLDELTRWIIEENAKKPELLQDDMRRCSVIWFDAFVCYNRTKSIGLRTSDSKFYFLARLLQKCFEASAPEIGEVSSVRSIDLLYSKYLPQAASLETELDGAGIQPMPIISNRDRGAFHDMIHVLAVHDPSVHQRLVELEIETLICIETTLNNRWVNPGTLLRADHGYVGMRNLGATCYQNSVLVQLFMNADLRKFLIAAAGTPEPNAKPSVLAQTQKCFAYLQESFRRSYNTQDLAACMKAGDGIEIPVGEQMDIREFYNLLFDQWEAELPEALHKQLRGFYGGAQVSRIQSKNCPHISEREEPFSSIQCTLEGAEDLCQSLANIVKGEQLNGDNKYKCEFCGHIDATRLTSFKDLPDNVAFHLMRFRYDVMASGGGTTKNLDYFSFPTSIDMSPYTYAHLASGDSQPDMFELVGAIQHAGNNAEGGHYISYAQIESATDTGSAIWAEFNDEKVTLVDMDYMRSQLYGGIQDDRRAMKNFSAYMLFYRRVSSTHKSVTTASQRDDSKAAIPKPLLQEILLDNTRVVQDYGFLSLTYKQHIWNLIDIAFASTNEGSRHNATRLFCAYISRVLNRRAAIHNSSKVSMLDDTIDHFFKTIGKFDFRTMNKTGRYFLAVLGWFATTEQALCDVMIRGTGQRSFCKLILRIFNAIWSSDDPDCVREMEMIACNKTTDRISPDLIRQRSIIYRFLAALRHVADATDFYESQLEHWTEYYKLHLSLACLDQHIACIMVEQGYLLQCLKLFSWTCGSEPFAGPFSDLFDSRADEANKHMRRGCIMPLEPPGLVLHQLLHVLDLRSPAAIEGQDRFVLMNMHDQLKIPISKSEEYLLNLQHDGRSIWLDLLLHFLENTSSKVWSSPDRGGPVDEERTCAKGVIEVLQQSRLPQHGFERAILHGLAQAQIGHMQAAIPIVLMDGETDFTRQCFDEVVRITETHDGENEAYVALTFLDALQNEACWRRPLLQTVARWAPRLMMVFPEEDEETLLTFVKKLLHKKWLTADETHLAVDSEDVLSAIRALFDRCNEDFNGAFAKSKTRDELEDLYTVMNTCIENLEIVAEYVDKMPENCKDDEDFVRLETWKEVDKAFRGLPEAHLTNIPDTEYEDSDFVMSDWECPDL